MKTGGYSIQSNTELQGIDVGCRGNRHIVSHPEPGIGINEILNLCHFRQSNRVYLRLVKHFNLAQAPTVVLVFCPDIQCVKTDRYCAQTNTELKVIDIHCRGNRHIASHSEPRIGINKVFDLCDILTICAENE